MSDPIFSPQFDGEKDSRNPSDFTNCPSAKPDDGDDEDEIEDDEEPVPAKVVAAPKTKPKVEPGGKGRHKTIVPASDVSLNHPIN